MNPQMLTGKKMIMTKKLKERKGISLVIFLLLLGILCLLAVIVFTAGTERLEISREKEDLADLRDAYAVIAAAKAGNDRTVTETYDNNPEQITYEVTDGPNGIRLYHATVRAVQRKKGWQYRSADDVRINGVRAGAKLKGDAWEMTLTSNGSFDLE